MISSSPSLDLMRSDASAWPLLDLLATMAKAFPTGCETQRAELWDQPGWNSSPGTRQISTVSCSKAARHEVLNALGAAIPAHRAGMRMERSIGWNTSPVAQAESWAVQPREGKVLRELRAVFRI